MNTLYDLGATTKSIRKRPFVRLRRYEKYTKKTITGKKEKGKRNKIKRKRKADMRVWQG
jgi:hypothetical protein